MDKNELDDFSQKLEQLHQDKEEARNGKDRKSSSSTFVFYKSAFYKQIEHQEKEKPYQDARHGEDLNKLKEVRDRLKRYS